MLCRTPGYPAGDLMRWLEDDTSVRPDHPFGTNGFGGTVTLGTGAMVLHTHKCGDVGLPVAPTKDRISH